MRTTLLFLSITTLFLQAETPEVTDAAERAFRRANAELAITVSKVSAQLPDKVARKEFDRAQTEWKRYCEAEANFRAYLSSQGASAHTVDFLSWQTDLTVERTKQIRKLIRKK